MELTDLLKSFTRTIMLGAALYSCGGEEKDGCSTDYDCREPRVCVRGYCEGGNGSGNGDNSNNDNNRDNDDKNQGNNQGNNLSPPIGKIVFASDRDTYQGDQRGLAEIYSINADGSNLRRLTNNSVVDAFPDWSPDGEKIVFTSHRDGDSEIYVMNADGSNQTNLTQSRYQDDEPRWSPEGRKIAFISDRDGYFGIYVMDSNGNNQQNLISGGGEYVRPAWSPDGEQIVFQSQTTSIYSELYKMNRDGSNRQQITFGAQEQHWDESPAWFPGQKIVFNREEDGQISTYTMNPDGSGSRRIVEDSYGNDHPCLSPDGNYIAFTHGPARIMIIPVEGGEEQELISGGHNNYGPSWGL